MAHILHKSDGEGTALHTGLCSVLKRHPSYGRIIALIIEVEKLGVRNKEC